MAQISAEVIQQAIEACRTHLDEIGELLHTAFECNLRLLAAEPAPYEPNAIPQHFTEGGLAVSCGSPGQRLLLLIPESLSLPAWYREREPANSERLQSFADEIAKLLLSAELIAGPAVVDCRALATPSLKELLEQSQIGPVTQRLELSVLPADAADGDLPVAQMLLVFPVESLPSGGVAHAPDATEAPVANGETEVADSRADDEQAFRDSVDAENGAATWQTQFGVVEARPHQNDAAELALRALRILHVPVTVSVRLAERKVPLGQVIALGPGALLTFNKSCEELLDLFVNNHRYCQGEAVKIGENFGLKVAKVGVTEERKEHVL